MVPRAGKEADFDPLEYRVDAPEGEGKTKNEPFHELCVTALDLKQLRACTLLFDGWDAAAETLKLSHRRKRPFVTTLKSNR